MSSGVYTSSIPPVRTYNRSLFTHLYYSSPDDAFEVGGYPGSSPAYIDAATGITISRLKMKHLALSVAHGLLHHPSLLPQRRGNTILVFSPNTLAYPVVMHSIVAAGLKCTPANSAYTSRELAHQYADSGSEVILTSPSGLNVVLDMLNSLGLNAAEQAKRIVVIGSDLTWAKETPIVSAPFTKVCSGPKPNERDQEFVKFEDLLSTGILEKEVPFEGEEADETCFICYSSGTTGKPKGVESTHNNLTTNIDMSETVLAYTHGVDRVLGVLPFFHIYGAMALLHIPFHGGVPVVIMTRFDPFSFCKNIQRYQITVAKVVPPILVVMSRHPAIAQLNMRSLKYLFSAAAPLGKDLIHRVTSRLRSQGIELGVIQGYGLTETSPIAIMLPPSRSVEKAGSVGILLPNLEARVVNESSGKAVDTASGEPGELWLRGRSVMKGYLKNPQATAESITTDRWFRTGDVVVIDSDGFYWIVDRKKELIKYKGSQVPPSELENVLLTHPEIADAAVIGVEDTEKATELPRAYIVHTNPSKVNRTDTKEAFENHVKDWIKSRVANHKYLRGGVVVIDVIPKSAAGKILRKELRERAKNERAGASLGAKAKL
ncbi:hypothetical protein AX16_003988 [Volvariella volvacea WC 439]|nr:hypothetical protein AX16_003988 [Volvariella volvacea WC 439]